MVRVGNIEAKAKVEALSIPEPNSGCWLWLGFVSTAPSPRAGIWSGGKKASASRFSYEAFKGPIPDGLIVRHTCDNPLCVNPDHLLAGTYQDNTQDAIRRGRAYGNIGALSEDALEFIRQNYVKGSPVYGQEAMGRRFGVSGPAIHYALKRISR